MDILSWEAPEFEDHERGAGWYYFVAGTALILIGISLWRNNFLFAVFLAIAVILLFVWSQQKSPIRKFVITDKDVRIDNIKNIHFSDIKSFSIRDSRDGEVWGELFLDIKASFRPNLHIHIPSEKVGLIRTELGRRFPEREHDDSLIDAVLRFLRF